MLRGVVEWGINFQDFRNVDLFHQGLYRVRCKIHQEVGILRSNGTPYRIIDLGPSSSSSSTTPGHGPFRNAQKKESFENKSSSTPSQSQGFEAQAFRCKRLGKARAQRRNNQLLPTLSIPAHKVVPGAIDDRSSSILTRVFLIRYCEEMVDLGDLCQFRIETLTDNPETYFTLDFCLEFADLTPLGGSATFEEQRLKSKDPLDELEFHQVAVHSFRCRLTQFSLHAFMPIRFTDTHACHMNVCVYAGLVDYRLRMRALASPVVSSLNTDTAHSPTDEELKKALDMAELITKQKDGKSFFDLVYSFAENFFFSNGDEDDENGHKGGGGMREKDRPQLAAFGLKSHLKKLEAAYESMRRFSMSKKKIASGVEKMGQRDGQQDEEEEIDTGFYSDERSEEGERGKIYDSESSSDDLSPFRFPTYAMRDEKKCSPSSPLLSAHKKALDMKMKALDENEVDDDDDDDDVVPANEGERVQNLTSDESIRALYINSISEAATQCIGAWEHGLLYAIKYNHVVYKQLLRTHESNCAKFWSQQTYRETVPVTQEGLHLVRDSGIAQKHAHISGIHRSQRKRPEWCLKEVCDMNYHSPESEQQYPIVFEQFYAYEKEGVLEQQEKQEITHNNLDPDTMELPSDPKPYDGVHLFVLVHGFQGNAFDVRLFKTNMSSIYPRNLILCSSVNEEHTEDDLAIMGVRLAQEVKDYIGDWCSNTLARLSFIGHSIGGLIIRTCLPHLSDFESKFHTYMSFGTMHLGFVFSWNKIVDAGYWALQQWVDSLCLKQLKMADNADLRETLLYKLTSTPGFKLFKHVVLVSSAQDQYGPYESTRIEVPEGADADPVMGPLCSEMVKNLLGDVDPGVLLRLNVNFQNLDQSLDNLIGRWAHIQFIENQFLMKLIMSCYTFLFI